MLLKNDCCVRALAQRLELTEANISKHLKVGLLVDKKRGYFMHYNVERSVLHELSEKLLALAAIKRVPCRPEQSDCQSPGQEACHIKCQCSDEIKKVCHDGV